MTDVINTVSKVSNENFHKIGKYDASLKKHRTMKIILNDIHEKELIIRKPFKLKGSIFNKIGMTHEFNDVELMDQRKLFSKTRSNGSITYNGKYVYGTFKVFSVNILHSIL